MNREQILKKIKKIEIVSSINTEKIFNGNFSSHFKGNGMEFSDIRRYNIGDDVKKIDWKVTARQRKTYVKEFREEKQLTIYFLVDISNSNRYIEKIDLIGEIIGSLGISALKNGDSVGAIFFTDKIEKIIFAKSGKKHGLSILDSYLSIKSTSKKTDISNVIKDIRKTLKGRNVIFLISDFLDSGYEAELKKLSLKNDVIPICIKDKRYDVLPEGFIYTVVDSESGDEILIENDKNISSENNSMLSIDVQEDYAKKLRIYFKSRRK